MSQCSATPESSGDFILTERCCSFTGENQGSFRNRGAQGLKRRLPRAGASRLGVWGARWRPLPGWGSWEPYRRRSRGAAVRPLPRLPASFRGRPAGGAGSPLGAPTASPFAPRSRLPSSLAGRGGNSGGPSGLRPRRGRGRRAGAGMRSQWAGREARGRGHTVGAATGLRARREGARRARRPERGAGAAQVPGRGRGRRSPRGGRSLEGAVPAAPPPPCGRDRTSALTSRRQVRRPLPGRRPPQAPSWREPIKAGDGAAADTPCRPQPPPLDARQLLPRPTRRHHVPPLGVRPAQR